MRFAWSFFFLLALTAVADNSSAVVAVTKENVFTFYRAFKRLTTEPVPADPVASTACFNPPDVRYQPGEKRLASPLHVEIHLSANEAAPDDFSHESLHFSVSAPPFSRHEVLQLPSLAPAPGKKRLIHLYANSLADMAILREADAFPVGAIIVKEKLAEDGSVNGVGGMIKHAPGYDAAHHDWEYFYAEAAGFTSGALQNCASCHANAGAHDYVFSVWEVDRTGALKGRDPHAWGN